jgi:arginase
MSREVVVLGVPSAAGACGLGQDEAPRALREAGLVSGLRAASTEVTDLGDSPPRPWRPDRANPRAQNLAAVVEEVRATAPRVSAALAEPGRVALVLGGDCTIGIGSVAGAGQLDERIGLIYFDLHAASHGKLRASRGRICACGA